jgi:signal transduction histidine kinase
MATSRPPPSSAAVVGKILDGIRSLIGIQDSTGRYLLVNTAMAEFHGLTRDAFIGKTPLEIKVLAAPLKLPSKAAGGSDDIAIDRNVDLLDATGRHRRFDIVRRMIQSGDGAGYVIEVATETLGDASNQDLAADPPQAPERRAASAPPPSVVAEAERAAVEHAEAERRLALALANGNLGLVDWSVQDDRLAANGALAKLLEIDDPSALRTHAMLASFEDSRDKGRIEVARNAHLAAASTEFHCEFRLRTARDRLRWVLAIGSVVERDADGRPLRYLGTLQDVTESIETEQELERQLVRFQESTRVSTALAREVKQLEGEIREISQREQERIGHDLHDGLGQELTGVSLLLKTLEDAIERDAPQLKPRVHSVRELVEQSIATTRALAHGLSPVHLDRDGFAGALEHLAANSESLYGIPVKFACQRRGAVPQLVAASDLYRIAQEAVRNAARHSGATAIEVQLEIEPDRLVVTVTDDGRGMPQSSETRGGMGLKIMRYRASIIGASLDIDPREDGGTIVRCTLLHAENN